MSYRARQRRNKRLPVSAQRGADPLDAIDLLGMVMHRAALLLPAERASVFNPAQKAFEAFRQGLGTHAAWCHMADALNVAQALAELRIAGDHATAFEAAQTALADVMERHPGGGGWVLRGAEIAALDHALWLYSVQLQHCSRGELGMAVQRTLNRMQQALHGNAPPGARVVDGGAAAAAAFAPAPTASSTGVPL